MLITLHLAYHESEFTECFALPQWAVNPEIFVLKSLILLGWKIIKFLVDINLVEITLVEVPLIHLFTKQILFSIYFVQ